MDSRIAVNSELLPTYFLSHGGGPWPWLRQEMPFYAKLETSLADIPRQLITRPQAVLMISAHWEATDFAVQATPHPGMIYDYGGFPEHTYRVRYAAPGNPGLAQRVSHLIAQAGLKTHLDVERGYDHGMFSPMAVIFPEADIPTVQLSIRVDYDPEAHFALGRALKPLRGEGVLILGSGLSYHNLRRFGNSEQAREASRAFDEWLWHAVHAGAPLLSRWSEAPSARFAHPREDHLVPLFVAYGAAEGEAIERIYHEEDFMGALTVSSFRFG